MELLNIVLLTCVLMLPLAWLLPSRWQMPAISTVCFAFLAWLSPLSLAILTVTGLGSYYIIKKWRNVSGATVVVVLQLVAIFIFFKLGSQSKLGMMDGRLIPLGLSYYSFRMIHYALEHFKGRLPRHSLEEYFHYLFFLPTMLVGPINRFDKFQKDAVRRRWDPNMFSYGLERILYGYFKVTVLGNFLLSNHIRRMVLDLQESWPKLGVYLEAMNYFFNSYFQFAGYSDVAIGLAALFGYRVMENFHYPFLARNVNDFWNRWHISLSSFARDYVYTPFVSMSRKPIIAIILTMLVIGLWHEFTFRYIAWAGSHAIAIGLWHLFNRTSFSRIKHPLFRFASIFLTFNYIVLSFIFIMRDDMDQALDAFSVLFGIK